MLDRLRALLSSRTDVSETLAPLDLNAYALDAALRKALKLSERWSIAKSRNLKTAASKKKSASSSGMAPRLKLMPASSK